MQDVDPNAPKQDEKPSEAGANGAEPSDPVAAVEPEFIKVRMVSKNECFGFKGRMFQKYRPNGDILDHEVDQVTASKLVDKPGAAFRRVDDEGNVILTEEDRLAAETKVAEAESRITRKTVMTKTGIKEVPVEPKAAPAVVKKVLTTGNKVKAPEAGGVEI